MIKKRLVLFFGIFLILSFFLSLISSYNIVVEELVDTTLENEILFENSFEDFVNDSFFEDAVIVETDLSGAKKISEEEFDVERGIEITEEREVIEIKSEKKKDVTNEMITSLESDQDREEFVEENFPNFPNPPKEGLDKKTWWDKFLEFFRFKSTGNAVLTGFAVDLPYWSYDGSEYIYENYGSSNEITTIFQWRDSFTDAMGNFYFNVELDTYYIADENSYYTDAIVYNKGYYLDKSHNSWVEFEYGGVQVGNTDWLREGASATIEIPKIEDEEDYEVFLAYACAKKFGKWECHDNKWVLFIVETGDVYYYGDMGEIPPLEYAEIEDLDLSNLSEVMEYTGVEAKNYYPVLHDAGLISTENKFEVNVGDTQEIEFYITNRGNTNLTELNFELDIGESDTAEVVSVDIPDFVGVKESVKGRINLILNKQGDFSFPLHLIAEAEEVDSSDNFLTFEFSVGEDEELRSAQDSLFDDWNRDINYSVKDPYSEYQYENTSLSVMSGTDMIRTVYGNYGHVREGSEGDWYYYYQRPTLDVGFTCEVSEASLFSSSSIDSFVFGSNMLAGDTEVVKYYVKITNENTGETYTTSEMESLFKYYYKPEELIPNFEFCNVYSFEVFLSGKTSEVIDVVNPNSFTVCSDGESEEVGESVNVFSGGTQIYNAKSLKPYVNVDWIHKNDNKYLVISGGVLSEYLEEVNFKYKVIFTDPMNSAKTYETRIINKSEGVVYFNLDEFFNGRYINFDKGEDFEYVVKLVEEVEVERQEGSLILEGWDSGDILESSSIRFFYESPFSIEAHSGTVRSYVDKWDQELKVVFYINRNKHYNDINFLDKILNETQFRYVIEDISTGEVVYDVISPVGNENLKISSSVGRPKKEIYFNYPYHASRVQELPEFKNGHAYRFFINVVSDNAGEFFVKSNYINVFYFDGFQFIANNPFLRTRFYGVPASPYYVVATHNGNMPRVDIGYHPANLVDTGEGYIDKVDITQREIYLSSLVNVFNKMDYGISNFYYSNYFPNYNSIKTFYLSEYGEDITELFSGYIRMTITPLEEGVDVSRFGGRAIFNCKIGRFDAVCSRGEGGYSVAYIDNDYNLLYYFYLPSSGKFFLARYRDNEQKYDAVIYDILSEIERNPIADFDLNYVFDKEEILLSPKEESFSFVQLREEVDIEEINSFILIGGDYPVGEDVLVEVLTSPDAINGEGDVVKNIVESASFYGENSTEDNVVLWLNGLSTLVDNVYYKVRVTPVKGGDFDADVVSFPLPFIYKKDYFEDLAVNNKNYLRKIPELNSTILGYVGNDLHGFFMPASSNFTRTTTEDYEDFTFINSVSNWNLGLSQGGSAYLPYFKEIIPMSERVKFISPSPYGLESEEYIPDFSAYFSVNPYNVEPFDDNEWTSQEELISNIEGNRRLALDSDKIYSFAVQEFNDYYNLLSLFSEGRYSSQAIDNIDVSSVKCNDGFLSCSDGDFGRSCSLTYYCFWADIEKLTVYRVGMKQFIGYVPNSDLENLDEDVISEFKDYTDIVLNKYLEWYPPTGEG